MNTKLHAIVDGLGNPVEFLISAGNDADSKHTIDLLKKVDITKSNILGDKAYGSKEIRSYITENKERHLVECFFQKLKWFRRITTRYLALKENNYERKESAVSICSGFFLIQIKKSLFVFC